MINSLRYKDLIQDVVLLRRDPAEARGQIQGHSHGRAVPRTAEKLGRPRRPRSRRSRGRFTIDISQPQRDSFRLLFERARPRRERRAPFGEDLSDARSRR